jgi:hypothetical protein
MYSARRWSARSVSATDGAAREDAPDLRARSSRKVSPMVGRGRAKPWAMLVAPPVFPGCRAEAPGGTLAPARSSLPLRAAPPRWIYGERGSMQEADGHHAGGGVVSAGDTSAVVIAARASRERWCGRADPLAQSLQLHLPMVGERGERRWKASWDCARP